MAVTAVIERTDKVVKRNYPYIGIVKKTNCIVYFTGKDEGLCLAEVWIGSYSKNWEESEFVPLEGKIVLQNG